MTQPSAPRRATIWIVTGVVVLVLLGVVGVVTLLALDSDEDPPPPAGQPATGSPTPSGDEFGPVPDLCDVDDYFAPVFDLLAKAELADDDELGEDGGLYQRSCDFQLADASSLGHLQIGVERHSSPQNARNNFRAAAEAAANLNQSQEDVDADWEEAVVLLDEEPDGASVRLITMDSVLVLDVWCYILGDASDPGAQQAAVLRVAENIRAAMRQ